MAIGDPVTQPIPPVGTAGTGYASQIVAFLTEVKARLEAKVAMTSLLVALLDMANNAISNVKYLGLYAQGSLSGLPVGSIAQFGGELYYVSAAGNVRITNAGHLDVVAALGITGDYAAPAEFRYDLATTTYLAYSDQTAAPKKWARLAGRSLDIYGTLTSTTRVRIDWPGGSSWVFTLPAAPPASQVLMQMDASGNVSASNTLANNANLKLQGTGYIQHDSWTETHPFLAGGVWQVQSGAPPAWKAAGTHPAINVQVNSFVLYPLDLGQNKNRVRQIIVHGRAFNATCNLRLYQTGTVDGSGTASLSAMNNLNTGLTDIAVAADGLYNARTITLDTPQLFVNGQQLFLRIETPAGATNGFDVINYDVVFDAP